MTQKVIRDYFAAFRFQKIKEAGGKNAWWCPVYFLSIAPLVLQVFESTTTMMSYYLIVLPIFFSVFASAVHKTKLPKIMYLCPMDTNQRKEYIIKSCTVRIAVSLMVDIVCVLILFLSGVAHLVMALGILLNSTLLSAVLGSGINANVYGTLLTNGTDSKTKLEVLEVFIYIVMFLAAMAQYFLLGAGYNGLAAKILSAGVPLLICLPMTVVYLTHWKESVERNMTYEG